MRPRKSSEGGYLLSVVAAALAMITIGSLIVCAYASRTGKRPQAERSKVQALYAAESGLLLAEKKLDGLKKKAPGPGSFVSGNLPHGAAYSVEVSKEHHSQKELRLLAQGSTGEGETSVQVVLEGAYKLDAKRGWRASWRRLK